MNKIITKAILVSLLLLVFSMSQLVNASTATETTIYHIKGVNRK